MKAKTEQAIETTVETSKAAVKDTAQFAHDWLARLRPSVLYLFRRIWFGHVLLNTSALAYSLLVTFVPLLASFSIFAAKLFALNRNRIDLFLSQKEVNALILKFLPYSSDEVNRILLGLVGKAVAIGWIGVAALLFSVFLLYGTLEETFNLTWKVREGRAVHKNLGMMFAIILLVSVGFGLYVKIGRLPLVQWNVAAWAFVKLASFGMLVLSFALLYKLVPATRVAWKPALSGGLFASLLYQAVQVGLKIYVVKIFAYNKIWGSLSMLPLFVLTIYTLALILVLGNEMAYVAQHAELLRSTDAGSRDSAQDVHGR